MIYLRYVMGGKVMDAWLNDIISATAWEMEKPAAYGAFHLTFTFVGFAVCIFAAYLLRNTSERGNRIVLISAGAFLMLTEVYKQLFYYYYIVTFFYIYYNS